MDSVFTLNVLSSFKEKWKESLHFTHSEVNANKRFHFVLRVQIDLLSILKSKSFVNSIV